VLTTRTRSQRWSSSNSWQACSGDSSSSARGSADSQHTTGALIGAASGVLFGVADLAVKALLGAAGHGPLEVLLSPWLPLALTAGLAAQYVSARPLQTGDAVSVTARTGLTVNVLNIVGGILIFGDPFANSLAGVLAEATAFSLICAATFLTPVPELETSHARAPLTA